MWFLFIAFTMLPHTNREHQFLIHSMNAPLPLYSRPPFSHYTNLWYILSFSAGDTFAHTNKQLKTHKITHDIDKNTKTLTPFTTNFTISNKREIKRYSRPNLRPPKFTIFNITAYGGGKSKIHDGMREVIHSLEYLSVFSTRLLTVIEWNR